MRKPTLLENLEARTFLTATIGETGGVTPQAGAPVISAGPNTLYFNAVKGQSSTYNLRIQNTGTKRLLLKSNAFRLTGVDGDSPGDFKVINFASTGRSIGAGATINVTVQFTAKSSEDNNIKSAILRIDSNDPKHPRKYVPLRGMPTNGTSGSLEPSLQRIFDLYGLPIKSGETDVNNYHFPTTQPTNTDEINAQTFVKAGDGNVTVTPMAVFTNPGTPAVRMGTYTPGDMDSGNYLWYVPSDTSQSVNPFYYGQTKFDPGTAEFGLLTEYQAFVNKDGTSRKVYSEKALNKTWSDSSTYNHFRVYPFINKAGKLEPNSYVVAEEEYEVTNVADNNDLVFLVTNVKPAASTPTLSTHNDAGLPDDDTLVFNKVQIPNADAPNIVRDTNTLTVSNSGQSNLVISTAVSGEYSITSGGGSNISIAPGQSHDIVVKLTSTSASSGSSSSEHEVKLGTLTITSNDPANTTKAISLRGYWQQYSEQRGQGTASDEPKPQVVVNDIFGYTTSLANQGQSLHSNGEISSIVGDEINAQYFQLAGGGSEGRVRVTELADYHSQTYVDANDGSIHATDSNMGWFKQGSGTNTQILKDKAGTGQMILPTPATANSTGVTYGSFKPGTSTFGFEVEGREYSDYSKNNPDHTADFGKFLRFFVAYDKNGVVIPNTYIMLHDYNTDTVNYDFNDNIYLISNVIPVGAVKTPVTASAVRNGSGARVFFTSPPDGPKIAGFNVYRSTSPRGVYSLLTDTPLAARPTTAYQDDTARADTTYYYAIESVGASGAKSQRVVVKA